MARPGPLRSPGFTLPGSVVRSLRRMNPWWHDKPLPLLPATRKHLVGQIHRRLELRLAPAVVVCGPRGSGKTTAVLQVLDDLLRGGVPPRNLCAVQVSALPELTYFTAPILRLVGWYEQNVLGAALGEVAGRGAPVYLFFDEIEAFKNWVAQVKHLVDSSPAQVLITADSTLRVELGGRRGLARRFATIETGT